MSIDSVKTTDATSKVQKFEKKPEFEPQSWEDSIAVIAMETARVLKDARHLLPGLAIVTTNQSVAVDSLEKLLLPPGYETKSSIIHFNSSDKRTQVEALLKDKTEAEKKDIARAFKEKTGKSLEDAFKVNFDGHVWESVVGWFRKSDKSSGDAERIRVALVERSQTFAGRSDKTCEKDLLDTISTLNSTQIAELSKEYKEKYGVALEDALLKDRYLGERTKQALQILLKGANRVTDVDRTTLAELAIKGRDLTLLQIAFRDAPQDLRDHFSKKFSDSDLQRLFGSNARHARDYMKDGKLSAATEVHENTTTLGDNEDAIERALEHLTLPERVGFIRGRELAKAGKGEFELQNPDDKKALAYFQQLEKALRRAGNSTEMLRWHDMIENKGGTLVSKLAEHRGRIRWTNDDTGKIINTVEKMSEEDWTKLKEDKAFKGKVIDMLKSYLADDDVARVKSILDQKIAAKTFEDSQGARRSLLDVISDNKGAHVNQYTLIGILPKVGYDPQKIIDAIISMPLAEQKRYREDSEFKATVDRAIADTMYRGPALETARALLEKISKGESPTATIVDRINMRTLGGYDASLVIRDIKEALIADPKLAARLRDGLKEGASEADKRLLESVLEAARKATSSSTVRELVKPLIETGKTDLEKQIDLSDHTFSTDRKGIFEDLSKLSKAERDRLLGDKTFQDRVLAPLSKEERQLAMKIVEQGEMRPEDKLRAAILEKEGKEVKEILSALSPAEKDTLRKNYSEKYGELSIDIADKLSGREKTVSLHLARKEGTVRQEFNYLRDDVYSSRDGLGSRFTNTWDGTGYQVDNLFNQNAAKMTESARTFKDLPIEEQRKFREALTVALDKFVESKGELVDGMVNISMFIVGIGGAFITGGASLSLVLKAMAFGVALKTAARAVFMGEDYDPTRREVIMDILTGGAEGALNVVALGQISNAMKYVSSAANKAFRSIFHGAESLSSKESVESINKSFVEFVQQRIKSGKTDISYDELFAFFEKNMKSHSKEQVSEITKRFQSEFNKRIAEKAQSIVRDAVNQQKASAELSKVYSEVIKFVKGDLEGALKVSIPRDSKIYIDGQLKQLDDGLVKVVEGPTKRKFLLNGNYIEYRNGQLSKVVTPHGVRAEKIGNEWKIEYPPAHRLYFQKPSLSTFDLDKEGRLVQETVSKRITFLENGSLKHEVKPEIFKVHGTVSREMLDRYKRSFLELPEYIRDRFAKWGGHIEIGRTLREIRPDIDQQIKAGIEKPSRFDDIVGRYYPDDKQVVLPEYIQVSVKRYGRQHIVAPSPETTLGHEVGHAIDDSMNMISLSPEARSIFLKDLEEHFSKLSAAEKKQLKNFVERSEDGTFDDAQVETFAELFAFMVKKRPDGEKEDLIERAFPNYKRFVVTKLKELDAESMYSIK